MADVYQYLDPLGLSIAGGRNGLIGVGGLTLGGGISYFAPRVGWACDNVVNFEVCQKTIHDNSSADNLDCPGFRKTFKCQRNVRT